MTEAVLIFLISTSNHKSSKLWLRRRRRNDTVPEASAVEDQIKFSGVYPK
jgi:hypothetical protein